VLDGHVYIEILKGMYGLPQASIIVNQIIAHRLVVHGYHQTKFTPGLWRHIIDALEKDYTFSKDWTDGLYCSITLKWDYANTHVDLAMPGYIKDARHGTSISTPCPSVHNMPHTTGQSQPVYGQRIQYAPLPDASPPETPQYITRAQ
jgi:hypothetical protein